MMRTDKYFGKRFDLLHAGLQLLVGSALRQELDGEVRVNLCVRFGAAAVDVCVWGGGGGGRKGKLNDTLCSSPLYITCDRISITF